MHVICKAIRRKIKSEANNALVAHNVNINLSMIKQTLQTYYGEKRNLTTLDHQLMSCAKHGQPIDVCFDQINKLVSAIVNHLSTDDRFKHPEALNFE